jgi:glycosyltransferase involved in cell wall biosynthesis
MQAGVPVVASAVGGIPDQIEHGRSGVLVPPDAPDALATAIVGLLADPARARALGEAGRRRALALFNESDMVARIERIYDLALASAPERRAAPSLAGELALDEQ